MMIPTYEFSGSKWLTFALVFAMLALAACTRKSLGAKLWSEPSKRVPVI